MRYHLRERAWSLKDEFLIRDEAGNAVFEVRGKFFHIGDDLLMYDLASGQEIARIKQRILSLRPSYDIYRDGIQRASVRESLFHLFGGRFKVQDEHGMVYHIDGDLWNWHFTITDDAGNQLAVVSRRFALIHDSYIVDVAPGVDAPLMLALAIVLEMVREKKHD